jgi:hypothetical protein
MFAVQSETEVCLALYGVLGRLKVHRGTTPTETAQRLRLKVTDLASGVYVLRLMTGSSTETQCVVVTR